jgi:hypothetical protein
MGIYSSLLLCVLGRIACHASEEEDIPSSDISVRASYVLFEGMMCVACC